MRVWTSRCAGPACTGTPPARPAYRARSARGKRQSTTISAQIAKLAKPRWRRGRIFRPSASTLRQMRQPRLLFVPPVLPPPPLLPPPLFLSLLARRLPRAAPLPWPRLPLPLPLPLLRLLRWKQQPPTLLARLRRALQQLWLLLRHRRIAVLSVLKARRLLPLLLRPNPVRAAAQQVIQRLPLRWKLRLIQALLRLL